MVKRSIHCCHNYHQTGLKKEFFTLPKVKPLNNRKSSKAREGKLNAAINNKQSVACINTINKGCANDEAYSKEEGTKNLRIFMHYFHPNAMDVNENGKIFLQPIDFPTLDLTQQALTSDALKENKPLPRFVLAVEEERQLEEIKPKWLPQKEKIKEGIVDHHM